MAIHHVSVSILLTLSACAVDIGATDDTPLVDDLVGSKADGTSGPAAIDCYTTDTANTLVKVRFTPSGDTFDIDAVGFSLASQRPSLNVYPEDGASDVPNEFVDFRPSGLDAIPAVALPKLELPLADGPKALVYADASTQIQLECTVSGPNLLAFLGIAPVSDLDLSAATAIGFDIDDTLLFSTPTFNRAFATGGTPSPTDTVFWTAANGCDGGCDAETLTLADGTTKQLPANDPSGVKAKARELVDYHRALGQEVYAITARPDINGDPLRAYLETELGFPADHVFFEPDIDQPGNPAGKTDRMAALGIDVFYGDSDSDITDARKVQGTTIQGIRFLRSPKSSYRSGGRLAKYHPGYYGEPIIADSYD
jgi:acid phosphatase (class B)